MAKIRYAPFSYQKAFQESVKPKCYLSSGYGGGKTYSLVMKAFQLMNANRRMPGGLLAPNLKMFKRDVLPTFDEICKQNRIRYKFHKTDYYFSFPQTGSKIYVFHAEDDGQSIRGPNLAFMLINEVTLCSQASFEAAIARVRLKKAGLSQVAMSGTPEGFNWVYDYFIADKRDDTDLIFGDMRDNIHIAENYAQMLIESYDEQLVKQYVGGQFVNVNSMSALHTFNRHIHCDESIEQVPGLPVWVTCDFNVNPMAATLWNRMPLDSPHILRAFDEIEIKGSADTYQLANAIKEKAGDDCEIIIFPDPAGNSRSTKVKDGATDITILESAGFSDIRYKSKIKSVRECLNAANAKIQKNVIALNPKKCKQTVQDFEQCSLKPGTNEIDKSDLRRTHWLDGFKNMMEYEFPIEHKRGTWRVQRTR